MKAGKKHKGTKAKVQAYKKRIQQIGSTITVIILVATIVVSSFLIYSHLNSSPNQTINPDQTNNPTSQPKAAIADHLSLTAPNQTFIQTATNTLKQAGYTVDYYPGQEVNVEFYRNLPTHDYSIIILRVHSTPLSLFTSEPYDQNKYVSEQLTDQLTRARYSQEDQDAFFGITAQFVRLSMKGRFNNSTIIMMGCLGLTFSDTAEAFIRKGAEAYISWNDFVLASHTDQATTHLLQHLVTERQTIKHAVTQTMEEVGPDPAWNSLLNYYPLEVGSQTVEDITSNPKTKP